MKTLSSYQLSIIMRGNKAELINYQLSIIHWERIFFSLLYL